MRDTKPRHTPEEIAPAGRAAGVVNHFTFNIHAIDAKGVRDAMPEIARQLSKYLQQIGQAPLVPNGR